MTTMNFSYAQSDKPFSHKASQEAKDRVSNNKESLFQRRRKRPVAKSSLADTSTKLNNSNGRIQHVEFKAGNVKKQRIPPITTNGSSSSSSSNNSTSRNKPVYTAAK